MGSVTTVTSVTGPQKGGTRTAAQEMEARSPFRSERVKEILRRLHEDEEKPAEDETEAGS